MRDRSQSAQQFWYYSINEENKFVLIPRGECEFVTKALNAQNLGAQMAIIMDDEDHQRLVIMKDNNYGIIAII
jgi:hypothetical protein